MEQDQTGISGWWKVLAGIAGLAFFGGIGALVTFTGDPENSLHTSAQSWSFMAVIGILAGLGIGTAIPALLQAFRRS